MDEHKKTRRSPPKRPDCTQSQSVTVDSAGLALVGTPRINLSSVEGTRREMCRVYRGMKTGEIDTQSGTRLVYVLTQIAKLIEIGDLEQRIGALEAIPK